MRWYLAFLVLLMAGYAAAFIVLFAPDVAAGRGRRVRLAGVGGHALASAVRALRAGGLDSVDISLAAG